MKRGASEFVAIGVGQGDAFLYRFGDATVLVDGGRSRQGLPSKLVGREEIEHLDVLVCTHNDADHASGVLGIFEAGLSVDEVWLPGSWSDRLGDLLRGPSVFFEELVENTLELEMGEETEQLDLATLGDLYADSERFSEERKSNKAVEINALVDEYLASAETAYPTFSTPTFPPWPFGPPAPHPRWLEVWEDWYFRLRKFSSRPARLRILWEALEAAEMIRAIASAAWHAGTTIRWFDYRRAQESSAPGGGRPGFLTMVNAYEILRVRPRHEGQFLRFLALTRSNRESLVLYAPGSNTGGVLFTGDSDLSFSSWPVLSPGCWKALLYVVQGILSSEAGRSDEGA